MLSEDEVINIWTKTQTTGTVRDLLMTLLFKGTSRVTL